MDIEKDGKKPLIGFFPGFYDIGECYPAIKIAQRYKNLGGEVIFFSYGGYYEYLAEDLGFKIIRFEKIKGRSPIEKRGFFENLNDDDLIEYINLEASTFLKYRINALINPAIYLSTLLSCRKAKIPLISIISGTWTPSYYRQKKATFPDQMENFLTNNIPVHVKEYILGYFVNLFLLNSSKKFIKKYNHIASKLNIDIINSFEKCMGDYSFVCDSLEFLGLNSTNIFPTEYYLGPILAGDITGKKSNNSDNELVKHISKQGRSILVSIGSVYDKKIFLEILNALSRENYNVIAICTKNFNKNEFPDLGDNIVLTNFVQDIEKINKMVDIAIIHGGRGTVYTAAYSGKPIIGIPSTNEQQYNLDCLVRNGTGIRVSNKFFTEKKLLNAINNIINNYNVYLRNAQSLAKKLPKPEGDLKAANTIIKILKEIPTKN